MPDASQNNRLPIVRPLDPNVDTVELFRALGNLPDRLWLDSATAKVRGEIALGVDDVVQCLSRYSFLTADPIHRLIAFVDDPNPWNELSRLAKALPTDTDTSLPPFQGGIAGVIGYEASRWIEPVELADCHRHQHDDHPTPAMSLGVYDWTIAIDHVTDQAWLICQGFTADDLLGLGETSRSQRIRNATARADQICELISNRAANQPSARIDTTIALESADDSSSSQIAKTSRRHATAIDGVTSNFSSDQFQSAVAEIVRRIRNGHSFQVNLSQRLTTASTIDAASLYLQLRRSNPAPFAGFYDGGDFQVLSSSPEGFLQIRNRQVETRPIKGTVSRSGNDVADADLAAGLLASEKDRAENIMIVDLMRNDLSRVCVDESVVVSRMCEVERYQFVQHLVSLVQGDLVDDVDAVDALRACFPGGSVTGAPKIEAMKTIAELESHPRGPYCGSMGYISCGGDADFNILIRTITSTGGQLLIPVGGGITARSEPASEEAETWAKATGMLNALPTPIATRP